MKNGGKMDGKNPFLSRNSVPCFPLCKDSFNMISLRIGCGQHWIYKVDKMVMYAMVAQK